MAAPVVNGTRHPVRPDSGDHPRFTEQGWIVVTVIDDGPGMTEELAERVFEPGFRDDAEDGHPGAGLGLALVRRLVVAAGGTAQATASASGGQGQTGSSTGLNPAVPGVTVPQP